MVDQGSEATWPEGSCFHDGSVPEASDRIHGLIASMHEPTDHACFLKSELCSSHMKPEGFAACTSLVL